MLLARREKESKQRKSNGKPLQVAHHDTKNLTLPLYIAARPLAALTDDVASAFYRYFCRIKGRLMAGAHMTTRMPVAVKIDRRSSLTAVEDLCRKPVDKYNDGDKETQRGEIDPVFEYYVENRHYA